MTITTPIPARRVTVGNRGDDDLYRGVWATEVIVKWVCPVCGGPRGDIRPGKIIEDGEYIWVHSWDNRCGHVDMYATVLKEAGIHTYKDPDRPRLALFQIEEDDDRVLLHAYQLPQDAWHRGLTEEEARTYGEPELWSLAKKRATDD